MANVGEQLLQPESGMKRIDDTFYAIKYNGSSWTDFSNNDANYNNGTAHSSNKLGDYYEIYCYTSKFNIISNYSNDLSNDIDVFVNSEKENISQYNSTTNTKICIFKKEFEKKQIIHIKVVNNTTKYINLDAIDIDEDGYMVYCDDNGKLYYDVTPIMTSNNTPSPYVVSTSSIWGNERPKYDPYKIFAEITYTWYSNSTTNSWVSIYLNNLIKTNFIMFKVEKTTFIDNGGMFKNCDIQISENGTDYITMKSLSNCDKAFWYANNRIIVDLKDIKNPKYIRFYCYDNNGHSEYITLGRVKFLLAVDTPFYLIQDNSTNKIYNYDEDSNSLVEVIDSSIVKKDALSNSCIYDLNKVLPLIDTLSNDLTLLCNNNNKVIAKGLKKDIIPLMVARTSFSTRLAENIDFFELICNISDTSSIKMAVSVDAGTTWKVWDNGTNSFIDLTNRPPLKKYQELTEEQLTQWDTFRDEVNEKGMDSKTLKNIDFNSILSDDMMFAYVFNRNSYEDKCEMSKLQYQFDAYGSYTLLNSDSTVSVKQSTDSIVVTPKKNMDLMKVNIGSSGEVTINNINGGESINMTEEEFQQNLEGILNGDYE